MENRTTLKWIYHIYRRNRRDLFGDRLNHCYFCTQTLNNLGKLYQFQKDYQQAEPLFKQAITICENLFGLKHPDTALYLSNLAELYTLQGRYQEADMLYQQALMIYQQTLPPEHPNIGIALEKYATLCEQIQRTDEARALRQQAQPLQSENTSSASDQSA